jgi:hypothetical protein
MDPSYPAQRGRSSPPKTDGGYRLVVVVAFVVGPFCVVVVRPPRVVVVVDVFPSSPPHDAAISGNSTSATIRST